MFEKFRYQFYQTSGVTFYKTATFNTHEFYRQRSREIKYLIQWRTVDAML
jgi:hypothetical protein